MGGEDPAERPEGVPARARRALQTIPGVGPSIAEDLWRLGVHRPADLRGQDPQHLYDRSCQVAGRRQDRCLLYVFRCAVYYVSTPAPDAELAKWWSWKDGGVAEQMGFL